MCTVLVTAIKTSKIPALKNVNTELIQIKGIIKAKLNSANDG